MITDRRALLEFTPDLARVLGEFLATPHAGRVCHRFQCTGVVRPSKAAAISSIIPNVHTGDEVSGRHRTAKVLPPGGRMSFLTTRRYAD